jgi:tetratricopeptide (TPR) repeat protein
MLRRLKLLRVPAGPALAALLLAVAVLGPRPSTGQPYPGLTPAPRTTDAATLRGLAAGREVVERIRLGIADESRRDWAAAAAEFSLVIALHPGEPQSSTAFYDLGIARAGLEDYASAAAAFRDAIARDPGFLAARANLVAVLLSAGDITGARRAADDLVDLAPDSARALYARGIVALRSGDPATALGDFRKLLSNDPQYAVAHYDLALAEESLGHYDDAERDLVAAIALAPAYTRARIALGALLLHEGKREEARLAFDDAVRSTPDPALRNLATSLRDAIPQR